MARYIEYVAELDAEQYAKLLRDLGQKGTNDKLLEDAKRLRFDRFMEDIKNMTDADRLQELAELEEDYEKVVGH